MGVPYEEGFVGGVVGELGVDILLWRMVWRMVQEHSCFRQSLPWTQRHHLNLTTAFDSQLLMISIHWKRIWEVQCLISEV